MPADGGSGENAVKEMAKKKELEKKVEEEIEEEIKKEQEQEKAKTVPKQSGSKSGSTFNAEKKVIDKDTQLWTTDIAGDEIPVDVDCAQRGPEAGPKLDRQVGCDHTQRHPADHQHHVDGGADAEELELRQPKPDAGLVGEGGVVEAVRCDCETIVAQQALDQRPDRVVLQRHGPCPPDGTRELPQHAAGMHQREQQARPPSAVGEGVGPHLAERPCEPADPQRRAAVVVAPIPRNHVDGVPGGGDPGPDHRPDQLHELARPEFQEDEVRAHGAEPPVPHVHPDGHEQC
ncbi:hypothetical protein PMKS-000727 [Pichia membranifaciens]|uniref:Uncharacterized protein n=1 Tax=Pichia membranifaciens TaxID=4926 RepID=A0A1Q2YCZ0_9ASCO|nr:hypothetical protein PMKS-000727 [Pichia membranifaciens]